jgi:nucleoside-diphosphate-sugar epimerase
MENKILVTGCAGFIGSSLCERLIAEGYSVIGIDNFDPFYSREIKEGNLSLLNSKKSFRFYELDITKKNHLFSINESFDVIIHLAAKAGIHHSILNPTAYLNVNIQGTLNVLDFMLSKDVRRIVFGSSSSVYGDNSIPPYKENSNTDYPISPYAFTKKTCELLLYNYFNLYRLSSISLRFFTVYGPRQRPDLAIYKFFNAVLNELPIVIYGDGSNSRDYTYIDDTVDGVIKALHYLMQNKEMYEIFNLGNNAPIKLKDLVAYIQEVTGKKAMFYHEKMQPGDVQHTCADITKAQKFLDYKPETNFREGLQKFYAWKKTKLYSKAE